MIFVFLCFVWRYGMEILKCGFFFFFFRNNLVLKLGIVLFDLDGED